MNRSTMARNIRNYPDINGFDPVSRRYTTSNGESCRIKGRPSIKLNSSNFRDVNWFNFCQRSTYHGLSDIYLAKGFFQKLGWLILVIAATVLTAYGFYHILKLYWDSPLLVSYIMRTKLERQLPDVAVCPFTRYDTSFQNIYRLSENLADHIKLAYGNSFKTKLPEQDPNLANNDVELKIFMDRHNWSFSDVLENSSPNCEDVIKYCHSPYMKGFYNCCDNSTTAYTGHGKCFRLNGPKQIGSGYDFGLAIVVSVPAELRQIKASGISVLLAEPNRSFGPALSFIPSGVHALMPLRSVYYDFVNMPPRYKCRSEPGVSSEQCFDHCVFKKPQQLCNCSHVTSTMSRLSICTPFQLHSCLFREVERLKSTRTFKRCREECVRPCSYWEYHPTVSYALFPADANLEYTGLAKMKNYVILNVFYERLEYPVVKHVTAMTVQQFVSNLGGQLGLWVGGSVLTLAQIVIFVVQYSVKLLLQYKEKRGQMRTSDALTSISGFGEVARPVYV